MASEVLIPELSWSLTFLCLILIVMLIAMCVCSKQTEKAYFQGRTTEFGTAGRLSMTRDSPIFQHQASNGTVDQCKVAENDSFEDDGSSKRNSWVVKDRALPDIPSVSSTVPTEIVVASVTDKRSEPQEQSSQSKRKTHNKHAAPKPPAVEVPTTDIPPDKATRKDHAHVMTISVTERSQTKDAKPHCSSSSSAAAAPFGAIHTHPWSQVMDCVPSTSDGSVVLRKIESSTLDTNMPSRLSGPNVYDYESTTNPYAEPHVDTANLSSSPVHIRIGECSTSSLVTPAGLAVAGAIPSSDIPYMTPPLLHAPTPGTSSEESPQRNVNSQAGHSEIPYTVISVREPLARVREMTMKKQRTVQQNSVEGENHYAMVPEEEQMYAEIGSGQDSGSSSITYAHIEPRELPPVPPTVESLKSVAHAHSRQASTVSTSSFGSCISGSIENTSPTNTQLRNPSSVYSSVEKNAKQRRTIHIAEGASVISSDKHKKVEDLYAKVRKKRVELTLSASSSEEYSGYQGIPGNDECMTPPPSPWASTTPPAPPPIGGRLQAASLGMLASSTSQHIRRHSADPNLSEKIKDVIPNDKKHLSYISTDNGNEPGYEQIYNDDNANDSCYEKIKDEFLENESKPGYESIHQPDAGFPGYATVGDLEKDAADPGYECVAQVGNDSMSSDPGYEPVRISLNLDDEIASNHGYTTVNLTGEAEPNYETVHKHSASESDAGYERVKKLNRNDSDATDPGYERVHNKGEPGYETVRRSDSDSEPGYEIVRHQRSSKRTYPNLCKGRTSTILFVSGENYPPATDGASTSKGEPDATFL